jgi:hypothetical protein
MNKVDNKSFFILWLLNPFISLIYLLRKSGLNSNIFPYLLISFFFGLSFVVSTSGGDSIRYANELKRFHDSNASIIEVINDFYKEESSRLDVYQPIITWLVSIFTADSKLLFALFALVFGYFWFSGLILIRSKINVKINGLILLSFIFLVLTNPIWNINGVRMWTAVSVFFYGILNIHLKKNHNGWIFVFFSVFIHFSLILSLIVYLLYRILPSKNLTLLYSLYLISFFIGELNLEIIRNYLELLPTLLQTKKAYISEEYVDSLESVSNTYSFQFILANSLVKYLILFICTILYANFLSKKLRFGSNTILFFSLGLFLLIFSNLASSVPSGSRFAVISNLVIITSFLFSFNEYIKINYVIKLILILILFYENLFFIRLGIENIGLFFFIGNPIVNMFINDIPLIEVIKLIS